MLTCEIRDTNGNPICGLMIHEGEVEYASQGFKYLQGTTQTYIERWCNQHDLKLVILEVDDAN